jgi:hypothetical protein
MREDYEDDKSARTRVPENNGSHCPLDPLQATAFLLNNGVEE